MNMRIIKKKKTVVYMAEESAILCEGKKRRNIVVGGRVEKVERYFLGMRLKPRYNCIVCKPGSVPHEYEDKINEVCKNIRIGCMAKIKEMEATKWKR